MMQALKPSHVPDYLRTSSFFFGLNVTDDDEFSVPANCMKLDTNVNTLADMTELLSTIRFWGSDAIPQAMIDFAARQLLGSLSTVLEPYRADLPALTSVCSIVSECTDSTVRLEKAMESGNLGAVQFFHQKAGPFSAREIALAAGKGALDCLQYALSFGNVDYSDHSKCQNTVYCEAVRNGHMECIRFLQKNGFSLLRYVYRSSYLITTENLVQIAALSGQCEVLMYLHDQGCSIHSVAINAADAGHFDCLEYALGNGALLRRESDTAPRGSLAQRLARASQLKLFPLVVSRGDTVDEHTALACADANNLHCFQLCVQQLVRPSITLIAAVVKKGYLTCLQCLHEIYVSEAERSGNGDTWITYAASNSMGRLLPADVAQLAANTERWECLRFLITHDCSMNKPLTTTLVLVGQLELYHRATAHGCKVSVQAACTFARDGNINLLRHSLEHGCERSEEILRAAARHGQLQCLMHAHAQGCPWSALVTLAAARGGHLECLQYLEEHGCPSNAPTRSVKRKFSNLG